MTNKMKPENSNLLDAHRSRPEIHWGLIYGWPTIWFGLTVAWCSLKHGKLSEFELLIRKLWLWLPVAVVILFLFYNKETRKAALIGLTMLFLCTYGQIFVGALTFGSLDRAIARFQQVFLNQPLAQE